jgi:hypothetical protein
MDKMAKNISRKSLQKTGRKQPLPSPEKAEASETTAQYLKGIKAIIVEQGLGKTRASILGKQLARHGGVEVTKLSDDTTHVLVGNSIKLAKLAGILKVKEISEKIKVVRADWLSASLKDGRLVDFTSFSLRENDAGQSIKTIHTSTEGMSCKTRGKRSIDALDELPCTDIKDNTDSDGLSDCQMPTTSKGDSGYKRRKVETDGDSDYINSDDDTEEGGTDSSDDNGGMKPTEISPHISPHKKVEMKKRVLCVTNQ